MACQVNRRTPGYIILEELEAKYLMCVINASVFKGVCMLHIFFCLDSHAINSTHLKE
jgi:hypothetical protein